MLEGEGEGEGHCNVLKEALEATDKACGLSKAQLDIEKYGGGMMLVIVLVRIVNYGKGGKRGREERRGIWNRIKKDKMAVYQAKCDAEKIWIHNAEG